MRNKGLVGVLMTLAMLLAPTSAHALYAETIYLYGSGPMIKDALEGMKLLMFDTYYRRIFVDIALVSFIFLIFGQALNQMRGWDKTIGYLIGTVVLAGFMFNSNMDIYIEDPVNGFGGTDGLVQDVPVGLALPAVLTSGLGRAMTEAIENYFMAIPFSSYGYPSAATLSHGNRFNFVAKMVKDRGEYRLLDPVLNRNFKAFVDECVVYRLFTGDLTMSGLVHSQDVWGDLRSTDSARLVTYTQVRTPDPVPAGWQGNQEQLVSCAQAYNSIGADINDYVPFLLAKGLNGWKSTDVVSFMDRAISESAAWMSQRSQPSGADLVGRSAVMNTFWDATRDVAGQLEDKGLAAQVASASATQAQTSSWMIAVDVFANSIGYLLTILQAFIFCCTPIVVLLILIPGAGLKMGGNFLQIMGWFAMIQPMMAIINYLITANLKMEYSSLYTDLPTLGSLPAMSEYGAKMMSAGNFAATFVPMLAWGMVKTAQMGMTSAIQSATSPKAADKAGMDSATGNTSLDNSSIGNANHNKLDYAGATTTGSGPSTMYGGVGLADQTANAGGFKMMSNGMDMTPTAGFTETAGHGFSSGTNYNKGNVSQEVNGASASIGGSAGYNTSTSGGVGISSGNDSRLNNSSTRDSATQHALSLARGGTDSAKASEAVASVAGVEASLSAKGAADAVRKNLAKAGTRATGEALEGAAEGAAKSTAKNAAGAAPGFGSSRGGGTAANLSAGAAAALGAGGALLAASGGDGAKAATALGAAAKLSDLSEVAFQAGVGAQGAGVSVSPEAAAAAAMSANPSATQSLLDSGMSMEGIVSSVADGARAFRDGLGKDEVTTGMAGAQLSSRLSPQALQNLGQAVSQGQPAGGGQGGAGISNAASPGQQSEDVARTLGGLSAPSMLGQVLNAASQVGGGKGKGGGAKAGGTAPGAGGAGMVADVADGMLSAMGLGASLKGTNTSSLGVDRGTDRRGGVSRQQTDGIRDSTEASRAETGSQKYDWGKRGEVSMGGSEQHVAQKNNTNAVSAGKVDTAGESFNNGTTSTVSQNARTLINMGNAEMMASGGGSTPIHDPLFQHRALDAQAAAQNDAKTDAAVKEQGHIDQGRGALVQAAHDGFNAAKGEATEVSGNMGQQAIGGQNNTDLAAAQTIKADTAAVNRAGLTQGIAVAMHDAGITQAIGDNASDKDKSLMNTITGWIGDGAGGEKAGYTAGNIAAHGGATGPIQYSYDGGSMTFTPAGAHPAKMEDGNYAVAGKLEVRPEGGEAFTIDAHAAIGRDDNQGYFIPNQRQSGEKQEALDKSGVVSTDGATRFNADQSLYSSKPH